MDRRAWWATVHRVTKRRNLVTKTTLSNALFFLCRSEFLVYIIFLFFDELLTCLAKLVYWQDSICLLLLHFWRMIFIHTEFQVGGFSLSAFLIVWLLKRGLICLILTPLQVRFFPFWLLSKKFCLVLNFCLLHMIYLSEDFWGIYLKSCSLSFLYLWFVPVINFWKSSAIITSDIPLSPSLLPGILTVHLVCFL